MTHEEYREKMEELRRLMMIDPEKGTPEGDRLLALAIEIEAYEKVKYPIEKPTPGEAAAFRREQETGSAVIPKAELKVGHWYVGEGRGFSVALWDGEDFVGIRCGESGVYGDVRSGHWDEPPGCFKPFEEIDHKRYWGY